MVKATPEDRHRRPTDDVTLVRKHAVKIWRRYVRWYALRQRGDGGKEGYRCRGPDDRCERKSTRARRRPLSRAAIAAHCARRDVVERHARCDTGSEVRCGDCVRFEAEGEGLSERHRRSLRGPDDVGGARSLIV